MRRSLDIYDLIISFIIFILVIGFIFGVSFIIDDKKWNNGYCQCGGEYVYIQAVGHQYTTEYLYECNKCGKVYESHKKR